MTINTSQLTELEQRRDALVAEAGDLCTRDLDEAATTRLTAIESELDGIATRHKALSRLATAAGNSANRMTGSGPDSFNINTRTNENPYDLQEIRSLSAFGADQRQAPAELRSRALAAIERESRYSPLEDDHKENAVRLLERGDGRYTSGIARHILLTGSPEYRSAFEEYMRNPTMPQFDAEESRAIKAAHEIRAALTLTSANGGYLVPFLLDPTIILTNNGATNPMREIATVKTVDVNVWHGVSSAGVTAEWIAEATEVADASPTFTQPTITCFKADAYIQGSWEVIADSGISSDLGMLIADAKDRLEAAAHITGTGSGQPNGVVTAISGITASRVAGTSGAAGAADFVVGDIYTLQNNLPPRARKNSSWLSEQTTYNKVRQFATGSGPQHAFWADLDMARPPLLLGRPAYEASSMDNTIVSGSNDDVLLLADFRQTYYIIDRIGVTMLFEPLVKGSSRRPTGEAAWVAYWRTGGDVVDGGTNARLLRL